MGDNYEDLGPANVAPPPPPPPGGAAMPGTPAAPGGFAPPPNAPGALGGTSNETRTELKSAPMGVPGGKNNQGKTAMGKGAAPGGKTLGIGATVEEDEEEPRFTGAQKVCMIISGISALFFLMAALASIAILITGFKVFT